MVTEDAADGETIRLASGLLKAGRRATKEIMGRDIDAAVRRSKLGDF
jgi:hypothetical protein